MSLETLFQGAKNASIVMRSMAPSTKVELIDSIADHVLKNSEAIIAINKVECDQAKVNGLSDSEIDRLFLDQTRIENMVTAAKNIAQLDDPIGEILESFVGENKISITKVRVPLGVVAVIYENRPNVTLDAACIALKSSNAIILRGSSSAFKTNGAIIKAIKEGIASVGVDENVVSFIDDPTRKSAAELMRAKDYVDLLIPRGGPALIKAIEEDATVPFVIDGSGNCHVYVDSDADLYMAIDIVVNSKTQRPSVCNAAESLIVHENIAKEFVPKIVERLVGRGVLIHGDEKVLKLVGNKFNVVKATQEDFSKEYLDLDIAIAVVDDIEDAIAHINKYASGHSECIVTKNEDKAQRFMAQIDSAVVLHNTSTRYSDGGRFGFGAEIGISTQKLHARGPMALKELTTYQYRVTSNGSTV